MAERRATVVAVAGSEVALRASGACSDCGGCGGRCNLFLSDEAGRLSLPLARFRRAPLAGEDVLLVMPEGWLARTAWRGYGVPLVGLLAGAAAGHLLAPLLGLPQDPLALAGALAGTLAAFTLSKGAEPQIAVRFPPFPDSDSRR